MVKIILNYIINNKKGKFSYFLEDKKESISTDFIKTIFYQKLSENFEDIKNLLLLNENDISEVNIKYEHIRYYSPKFDAYLLLRDNEEYKPDKENNILLIKISIEREKERKIREQFLKINDEINGLSDKIQEKLIKNYKNDTKDDDSNIHIAVLTSNPLMNNDNNEELRSINDFNRITKSIYETIKDRTIIAKFLPLTMKNLKKVINDKPRIIHLICKSTYIEDLISKGEESYNYVNLIFEDDDYFEMKAVKKEDLGKIFMADLVKNTLLIISTPLAEDVYNIVKDYKFKNIFVQHTTIANSLFIENFNKKFYSNIPFENGDTSINKCFLNAKKSLENEYSLKGKEVNGEKQNIIFKFCCCCRHKHKLKCPLFKNLQKELYSCNIKEKKDINSFMPHFSHLRYKGEDEKCCCCNIDECKGKDIFYHNFKEEDGKTIKLGSRNNGIYLMNNCFPCTEIIYRKNKIIYELYIKISDSNTSIINIYNNSNNIDDIIIILNLAKIIMEYFEERIHLLYSDEDNGVSSLPKKSISLDNLRAINNEENDLRTIISSPNLLNMKMNKDYKLKKISLIEDKHNIRQTRIEPNTIYFIIALDDKMIDQNYLRKFNKCIVFTKNELKMENLQKFKIEPENSLNYAVKYEQKKIEYSENDFDGFININLCNNEILKKNLNDDNKSKIKSEILYYFYLIKSYINKEHLEIIFKDKEEEIIKDEFRIIINFQEKKNIYKKVKDYFGLFYSEWKITDDIKGKVLAKLFRYYCNLFKYIINKSKERYQFIDNDKTYSRKLKYRPAESLSSFSVMQNLGIWKQQKKEEESYFTFKKDDVEVIFNPNIFLKNMIKEQIKLYTILFL